MTTSHTPAAAGQPSARGISPDERRVLGATLVGSTIEWYDFFIYAQAASLVFAPLFFAPMTQDNPELAQVLAFLTVGISFLFRPLGAVICGHLGDRMGRKAVLVFTLMLMGGSTVLIGLLPPYAEIGYWAPLLLVLLRIAQGFSAGGEWGGAALMAVEYAPVRRRSFFGAFPQIGVPLGMIVATLVLLCVNLVMGREAFVAWGWRIPFLISALLIVVGVVIRRSVEESPVFRAMHQRKQESATPLRELFTTHRRPVTLAALTFIANNAAGYILIAFLISYGQKVVGLSTGAVLTVSLVAAGGWLVFTLIGGLMGDSLGRVRTFMIGYVLLAIWAVPMWFLIDTKDFSLFLVAALGLTIPLGITYGPMAALYAEMFPARVRYSGVSIAYAIGAILGGAFAPSISQALISTFQAAWTVGAYLLVLTVVSLVAVSRIRDPQGIDLTTAEPSETLAQEGRAQPQIAGGAA